MSTNSIDFSATDKMTVVSGVRKLSDASVAIVLEFSASVISYAGSFWIAAPISAGGANYSWASRGTLRINSDASPYASPIANVVTGVSNIADPVTAIRVNSSQITTSSASQGTGTYGNYPLYLFARANASLFLNGYFYGAIIRGATTSGTDLTNAESYMNTQSGGLY